MNLENLDNYINNKINTQGNFIKFTFYEIRIKLNIDENDLPVILELIKNKLENNGYKVYFTGEKYMYASVSVKVKSNELIIAVKE